MMLSSSFTWPRNFTIPPEEMWPLGTGNKAPFSAGEMLFGAVTKPDLIHHASCGKAPTQHFSEAEQDLTIPGKTKSEQVTSFCRN